MTSSLLSRERLKRIRDPWAQRRALWLSTARAAQLPPPGGWSIWLNKAGRGFGKTRGGAEYVANEARKSPGLRILLVGRTYADARDVIVEGVAGVKSVIPEQYIKSYNRSLGELILKNGSRFEFYGAEDVDRIRGHEYDLAWLDELAAYTYPQEMFDAVMFTLRSGENPRCIITTTPRPIPIIRELEADPEVPVTHGTTYDNPHLSKLAVARLEARYGGTRLGRQELEGFTINDVVGALWTSEMLASAHIKQSDRPDTIDRLTINVDPNGGGADEVGITATGRADEMFYLLSDQSAAGLSPAQWSRRVVICYMDYNADAIIAEKNYGGEMVRHTVQTAADKIGVSVNIQLVNATRGKAVRAEPVSALYEQGRVKHVGAFPELEDQLTTWVPGDKISPDRLDSLVWGITDLMDEGLQIT